MPGGIGELRANGHSPPATIPEADAALAPLLAEKLLLEIVDLVPEEWLQDEYEFADTTAIRAAYVEFLSSRLEEPRGWVRALEESRGQAV
jgi:hypothetical protein